MNHRTAVAVTNDATVFQYSGILSKREKLFLAIGNKRREFNHQDRRNLCSCRWIAN